MDFRIKVIVILWVFLPIVFLVSCNNTSDTLQTTAETATGLLPELQIEKVALGDIALVGESVYDESKAYLLENIEEILGRNYADASVAEPFHFLYLNNNTISLDHIYYPLVTDGQIVCAVNIYRLPDSAELSHMIVFMDDDLDSLNDALLETPDEKFIICCIDRITPQDLLISPNNEIILLTNDNGVYGMFDDGTDYYNAFVNEYSCLSGNMLTDSDGYVWSGSSEK
nr:hypothetical protein [Clostridia bacterium]